jgi:hypothetical protein
VHGKTFGVFASHEGDSAIIPTLTATVAILNVMMRVADNCVLRSQCTAASDILRELLVG